MRGEVVQEVVQKITQAVVQAIVQEVSRQEVRQEVLEVVRGHSGGWGRSRRKFWAAAGGAQAADR